jgi:hypothetical protein
MRSEIPSKLLLMRMPFDSMDVSQRASAKELCGSPKSRLDLGQCLLDFMESLG